MLALHEEVNGRVLVVHVAGKVTKDDNKVVLPDIERLIQQHAKLRILCQMHDFHGWTPAALWEDIRFDVQHCDDIERLAIVGQRKWQAAMVNLCKPFTAAEVRYFDESETRDAREWIHSGLSNETKHNSLRFDAVQQASEESFPASDAPAY